MTIGDSGGERCLECFFLSIDDQQQWIPFTKFTSSPGCVPTVPRSGSLDMKIVSKAEEARGATLDTFSNSPLRSISNDLYDIQTGSEFPRA